MVILPVGSLANTHGIVSKLTSQDHDVKSLRLHVVWCCINLKKANVKMVKLLYLAGVWVDFVFGDFHTTALHVACDSSSDNQDLLKVIRYLVEVIKVDMN